MTTTNIRYNLRIVLDGYRRLYVTDTAELTTDIREAKVFCSPCDNTELNSFMAFMRDNYQDRVNLEIAGIQPD